MQEYFPKNKWRSILGAELEKDYFQAISAFLEIETKNGGEIYPPRHLIFSAFNETDFDDVKVVILGQDPYHGFSQAHGLAFSVRKGTAFPPSLANIFKELTSDLGQPFPKSGDLSKWASQGVLLLNSVLTVRAHSPQSHSNIGWQTFTRSVITSLNSREKPLVFLLWGGYAQDLGSGLDEKKHRLLRAPHPSPLSAYRGFFGCKHFSKSNEFLILTGQTPIDWQVD